MALDISKQLEQISTVPQYSTVTQTKQVNKEVSQKFLGYSYEPVVSIGVEFKDSDNEFNEIDKWFVEHLYYSVRSDGGLNFIAAIDDDTKRIIMLPLGTGSVTQLTEDAPYLLPTSYIKKIESCSKSDKDTSFQIKTSKDFGAIKDMFPKFMLKKAEHAGLYGEQILTTVKLDGKLESSTTSFNNAKWRLGIGKSDLIDPVAAFSQNVICYKTKANTSSMEKMKIYSTNKNEFAMKHLDLDSLCEQGSWETWKEFFHARKISGDKLRLLMGMIWAIYDESYKTRQMIYWYDPNGYSGKSVMLQALAEPLLDIDAYGVYTESNSNGFTNERLWDKRLLVVPDNKNPKIVKYGRFHQLTGGDAIDVDSKYRKGFTVKPDAKVFAVGNILPEVDLDARHETSRIAIFTTQVDQEYFKKHIEHEDGTLGDPTFGDKLKSELHAFLFECRKAAQEINPNKGDFNTKLLDDEIKKCAEAKLIYFETFINDNLEFGVNEQVKITDLGVRYESFKNVNKDMWSSMDRPEYGDFKEHLTKILTPNIVEKKHKRDGWYFTGVCLKGTVATQANTNKIDDATQNAMNKLERFKKVEGVNGVC